MTVAVASQALCGFECFALWLQRGAVHLNTSTVLRGRCLQAWWHSCLRVRLYGFSACHSELLLIHSMFIRRASPCLLVSKFSTCALAATHAKLSGPTSTRPPPFATYCWRLLQEV